MGSGINKKHLIDDTVVAMMSRLTIFSLLGSDGSCCPRAAAGRCVPGWSCRGKANNSSFRCCW